MANSRPVARIEVILHVWAVPLLLLVCVYRLIMGYLSSGSIWLSDPQILVVCLLLAGLLISGSFVSHRQASLVLSFVIGLLAWITVVSLIPRGLWSGYPLLRSSVPLWLLVSAGVVCLGALSARWWLLRRWLAGLSGHGFKWIHSWTDTKPLYARLLAQRILTNLGYSFERQ